MRKILNYLDKEGLKYLIAKIKSEINNKVDKVDGKSLSTNDFTTTEKNKLAGIATNANNYVLPTASATVLGGIKVGSNLTIVNGVLSAKDGIALGTTSSTAFRGDYGNTAYAHSQKTSGNPHKVTKSDVGLGNVDNTADANKSVKYATSAGNATTVSGHTVAKDVPSNAVFTDTNTWVKASTTADGYISKLSGNTSQYLRGDGTWATPPNTTYRLATSSANGLLSSTDFTKLSKVTATEMGYLSGVKSSIQNQINNTLSKTNTTEYIPTSDYHPATKIYVDNKVGKINFDKIYTVSWISDGNNSGFGLTIDGITSFEDIRNKEIKFTTSYSYVSQIALNTTTNFIIKNEKGETFIKQLPFRTFISGGVHTVTYDDNNNIVIDDYVKALRLWYEGIFAYKKSSFSSLKNMAYYFDFPNGDSLVTEFVQAANSGKPVIFYHNKRASYPGSLYLETASNSSHPFKIKKMTLTCYRGTTIETAQFTYDSTSETMLATYNTKTL